MVKGKNKEELGLSKKAIFKQLKEKLENAAKTPGFFDVGEAAPDIDLICKGNKDGSQLFACPDAQFIQVPLCPLNCYERPLLSICV